MHSMDVPQGQGLNLKILRYKPKGLLSNLWWDLLFGLKIIDYYPNNLVSCHRIVSQEINTLIKNKYSS